MKVLYVVVLLRQHVLHRLLHQELQEDRLRLTTGELRPVVHLPDIIADLRVVLITIAVAVVLHLLHAVTHQVAAVALAPAAVIPVADHPVQVAVVADPAGVAEDNKLIY